eukprot:gene25259-10908_t
MYLCPRSQVPFMGSCDCQGGMLKAAKVKVGGGKRFKAVAAAVKSPAQTSSRLTGPAPPKHVQRKIARKVGFLDKVAASKSLKTRSGVQKKSSSKKKNFSKALSDLSSLSGSLSEVAGDLDQKKKKVPKARAAAALTAAVQKHQKEHESDRVCVRSFGSSVKGIKSLTAIMVQESARTQQVLKHPLFLANPMAAIMNHLNATVPPPPVIEPATNAKNGMKKRKGGKEKVVTMDDFSTRGVEKLTVLSVLHIRVFRVTAVATAVACFHFGVRVFSLGSSPSDTRARSSGHSLSGSRHGRDLTGLPACHYLTVIDGFYTALLGPAPPSAQNHPSISLLDPPSRLFFASFLFLPLTADFLGFFSLEIMPSSRTSGYACLSLSILAIIMAIVAICGKDSGWAYANKDMADKTPWAPQISIVIKEGWWTYSAVMKQGFVPGDLPDLEDDDQKLEGDDQKVIGVITIVACSLVIVVSLLHICVTSTEMGWVMRDYYATTTAISPNLQAYVVGAVAVFMAIASVGLYACLAIGTHNQLKDQFGDDFALYPLPSWASICAWFSTVSLMVVAVMSSCKSELHMGYTPLV